MRMMVMIIMMMMVLPIRKDPRVKVAVPNEKDRKFPIGMMSTAGIRMMMPVVMTVMMMMIKMIID